MANGNKTVLSPFVLKIIGAIMGGVLTLIAVSVLMNLQVTHTHPDSSKELVVTLTKEVEKFKERSVEERVKINSLEGKLENYEDALLRLTAAVQSLERKVESLRLEYGRFKDDLTKTLIEVIKAR